MTRYAERTEVSSEKSRSEIEKTLRRYGATAFAYGWQGLEATVMFELADRRIRFAIPMPDPADGQFVLTPTGRERSQAAAEKEYEQAVRQSWRALALVIKAKLEAVDAKISTVEDEFLAHVVLPDGSTVGDWVAPQLQVAYSQGQMPALLPGGGS
ncbi:hypothetical protein [Actinomadura rudentiformis]|uniref:Uncharacterized protein n=1 Tax=Actinomadura rudentiformis TaxID=359158 RepID=A0A6H9YMV0_9ACTN|nr:hypothetical protein [Actinomadura rudentiformis]KAB2347322.1 hypothetical protein F8566_20130 [Actinomadura rudentiformis]